MASDEIVWQVIAHQFCSFKLKTTKEVSFCRNEYNVTGLCNRQSCPLANSRYATVRSENGTLYLYMKTVERAHMPSKLWERIKLSQNYTQALKQIDDRLIYWPSWLIHKCKQRLTRLVQVAIRTRKVAMEEAKMGEKLVGIKPKIKRREATRERKALAAAKLERNIEKELIERLKSGAYGDKPLNVEEGIWKRVLKGLERGGDAERDVDYDEEEEDEEEMEEEEEGVGEVEYVSGDDLEEDEDLEDFEDWLDDGSGASSFEEDDEDDGSDSDDSESEDPSDDDEESRKAKPAPKPQVGTKRKAEAPPTKRGKKRAGPRVEIEYEDNVVPIQQKELAF